MFGLLRKQPRQPTPEEALDRLHAAAEEVNRAVNALPMHMRHLRPYVTAVDSEHGRRNTLAIGFWEQQPGGGVKFVIVPRGSHQ